MPTDASIACAKCGKRSLDLHACESVMVLRSDLALFGVRCPHCGALSSLLQPIPRDMREELHFAAIEIGAGGLR